jgi:archaemetzincin
MPKRAYAFIHLVGFDLYKTGENVLCCSLIERNKRIAVVSSARFHPALDKLNKIDRVHSWPASHCHTYAERSCQQRDDPPEASDQEDEDNKEDEADEESDDDDVSQDSTALAYAIRAHKKS